MNVIGLISNIDSTCLHEMCDKKIHCYKNRDEKPFGSYHVVISPVSIDTKRRIDEHGDIEYVIDGDDVEFIERNINGIKTLFLKTNE